MTTEQQIQLKQLEKECLELQIKLEELKKSNNGTFTYPITYPQNPNTIPAFPNTPYSYGSPIWCGGGTISNNSGFGVAN